MAELPGVLKVVAPSLQEQEALWKLWTCWEEATAQAETLLPQPCPGRAEDWRSAQAQRSSSLPQLQADSKPDGEGAPVGPVM